MLKESLGIIIAAAGTASRMKNDINKPYILLNNKAILAYTLDKLENCKEVDQIVIVANPKEIDYCQEKIIKHYKYQKVTHVLAGGNERQDSIYNGLQALGDKTKLVGIHDAARPFFSLNLLESLIAAANLYGAAIPGVSPKDTLKLIDDNGFVDKTLNREQLVAVQTPQLFDYHKLLLAYQKAYEDNFYATDDAALYEKYIGKVKVLAGEYTNIKITTAEDLDIAKVFLNIL